MSATDLTAPHTVRARARARAVRGTPRPEAPWTSADRSVTAVVLAVGVLLIVIAWVGASDTTDWDAQLSWTAVAMAGVVVVCTGVGIWLFRGFARVRAEAREVRRALVARIARNTPVPTEDIRSARVTVAGMTHHHAPDCLLVAGKTTVAANEASAAALAPCGICG